MNRAKRCGRRFRCDDAGVSGVEFAILLPLLLIVFFGGFAVSKTVALSRKVTITTRALADLTSQYKDSMAQADMTTVMNASKQIIAPYDSSPMSMRISEITTDLTGQNASITWSSSSGSGLPAYKQGTSFTMPAGIFTGPSISFIYAETSYPYKPPFGTQLVGTIGLSDRIFMMPRKSTSISYSGS